MVVICGQALAGASEPISEVADLTPVDMVIHHSVQNGKADKTVIPRGALESKIPASILGAVEEASGEEFGAAPTLTLSAWHANEVEPGLEGRSEIKVDVRERNGRKVGKAWRKLSIVNFRSVRKEDSSFNACEVLIETLRGRFKIYVTWYVNKTGEIDGHETIEGAVHWLGPMRLPEAATGKRSEETKEQAAPQNDQGEPPATTLEATADGAARARSEETKDQADRHNDEAERPALTPEATAETAPAR
jgi:hypothetical protein